MGCYEKQKVFGTKASILVTSFAEVGFLKKLFNRVLEKHFCDD